MSLARVKAMTSKAEFSSNTSILKGEFLES
jgi:hypothetical protein